MVCAALGALPPLAPATAHFPTSTCYCALPHSHLNGIAHCALGTAHRPTRTNDVVKETDLATFVRAEHRMCANKSEPKKASTYPCSRSKAYLSSRSVPRRSCACSVPQSQCAVRNAVQVRVGQCAVPNAQCAAQFRCEWGSAQSQCAVRSAVQVPVGQCAVGKMRVG